MIILARKILPISGPDMDDGALVVDGSRIADVGTRASMLSGYKGKKVVDLGDVTVLPGLVNLHAHLELSVLKGLYRDYGDFFGWIAALVDKRRGLGDNELYTDARKALKDAVATGTTCICDVSSSGVSLPIIAKSGVRGVIFMEVIGLDPDRAVGILDGLKARLKAASGLPDCVGLGVSPHSPYSVSAKLFKLLGEYISEIGLAVSTHLSETADEALHLAGKPSMMDGYMDRVGWGGLRPNTAPTPLSLLKDAGLLGGRLLAVHGVHLNKGDMDELASAGASVVHCPRSNNLLGVGSADVREMMSRGVNVGLGTDSLASCPDMDMWEEMRFARGQTGLSPRTLIEMATVNGARALGLDGVTGTLEPGKYADFIAVKGSASGTADPYSALLADTRMGDVILGMVMGRSVYSSSELRKTHGL